MLHPDCSLLAAVAELADALASGASARKGLRVQISPAAQLNLNLTKKNEK